MTANLNYFSANYLICFALFVLVAIVVSWPEYDQAQRKANSVNCGSLGISSQVSDAFAHGRSGRLRKLARLTLARDHLVHCRDGFVTAQVSAAPGFGVHLRWHVVCIIYQTSTLHH
eukprot:4522848-Amphidinium_carterae.1